MERAYVTALDAGRKDLQTIAAQALAQTHIDPARARRGRAPAHACAGARRGDRERACAAECHARVRLVPPGEGRARRGGDDDGGGASNGRGVRHGARHGQRTHEARLGRAPERRPQALGEAVPRGPPHHRVPRRSRPRSRLPGGARDDTRRSREDRRRGTARARRTSACGAGGHELPDLRATALAAIRAAQGRDDDAEQIFLSAIADARDSNLKLYELHPLERLTEFLRARGRDEDAAVYEARIAELSAEETDSRAERIA